MEGVCFQNKTAEERGEKRREEERNEEKRRETSVTWRDCCVQMCLPAAPSNAAVGPEQTVRGASCPVNQRQFVVRGQLQLHGSLPPGGRILLLDTLPDIDKKKFLVPGTMLCGEFKYIIHKH